MKPSVHRPAVDVLIAASIGIASTVAAEEPAVFVPKPFGIFVAPSGAVLCASYWAFFDTTKRQTD